MRVDVHIERLVLQGPSFQDGRTEEFAGRVEAEIRRRLEGPAAEPPPPDDLAARVGGEVEARVRPHTEGLGRSGRTP